MGAFKTLLEIEKCMSEGMDLNQTASKLGLTVEYITDLATKADNLSLSECINNSRHHEKMD